MCRSVPAAQSPSVRGSATLSETTTSPENPTQLAVKRPEGQQACQPKGSITRDGNIVSVKLNWSLANFTINNPDPNDAYGGEDPVTLRSYGGCKSGPMIEVKPGNTLRIDVANQLDANDPSGSQSRPAG